MPAANASTYMAEAERTIDEGRTRIDAGLSQSRLDQQFQEFMPQFKAGVASQGQHYSTARQTAEKGHAQDYLNTTFDIQNALQRRLDDFTRQRMYASVGLVGF